MLQVELVSTDAMDKVDVRYIMSLKENVLSSELVVTNAKNSPIKLMGSVLSHLTVSTPEATYACGLERSDYCSRPMLFSSFSIVPPDPGQENEFGLAKLLNVEGLRGFWSGWGKAGAGKTSEVESEAEMEGEEDDNYKQLTEKMSRIYTSAPQDFTIIDRVLFMLAKFMSYFDLGFAVFNMLTDIFTYFLLILLWNREEETRLW